MMWRRVLWCGGGCYGVEEGAMMCILCTNETLS